MKDLVIIGGGPAGTSAGVYAARKRLNTVLITKEFGGQSVVSSDIQNWIGTPHISGDDLAKAFKSHLLEYADTVLTLQTGSVASISKTDAGFLVTLADNSTIETKTVLITAGADRRKLSVPGADTLLRLLRRSTF